MAAGIGSPPRQPHVPAWKRLGLKLKYAKEHAASRSPDDSRPTITSFTSIGDDAQNGNLNDDSRPLKKRRTSVESPKQPQNPSQGLLATDPSLHAIARPSLSELDPKNTERPLSGHHGVRVHSTNSSQAEQSRKDSPSAVELVEALPRRKSVTFATDTKAEAGSLISSHAEDRIADAQSSASQARFSQQSPSKEKGKRRQKQAESTKEQAQASSDASHASREHDHSSKNHVPEYVTYLQLFHTDKPSWKFNKNKQKDLVKNLFNIQRLPPEHNEAILQYIIGLQGAAARQRVVESATAVLKEIAEKNSESEVAQDMEFQDDRVAAYRAALRHNLEKYHWARIDRSEYDDQQLEEMRQENEKGERAKALLEKLLKEELHPDQTPATSEPLRSSTSTSAMNSNISSTSPVQTTASSKTIPKRKRRKQRTTAPTDDDDSDTSESEGEYNPKRGPATVHEALKGRPAAKTSAQPNNFPYPKPTGTRKIFDDDLLDQIFPKKQRAHQDTAPKRKSGEKPKVRGFASTHGTRVDESDDE